MMDRTGWAFGGDRLARQQSEDDAVLEDVPGYRQTQSYVWIRRRPDGAARFQTQREYRRILEESETDGTHGVSNTRLITALRTSGIRVRVTTNLTFVAFGGAIER